MSLWQWIQFVISFSIVIGLAYYVSRFLGQRILPMKNKELRVLESASLGGRRFLTLVQARDRVLLIGVTDHSINLLGEWNDSEVGEPDAGEEGLVR